MPDQQFSVVRKGYDPTQVNQTFAALQAKLAQVENQLNLTRHAGEAAAQQAQDQQVRVDQLEAALQSAHQQLAETPDLANANFDHLGARVAQILNTAQDEADELREKGQSDLDQKLLEAHTRANKVLEDARSHADEVRSSADAESARIVEEARTDADHLRSQAESEAAAARDEVAALLESHRARATAATIDFEKMLEERRHEALAALEDDVAARHEEINAAIQRLSEIRSESQRTEFESRERAEQIVRAAEQRSNEILSETQVRADQIRENAERELNAALSRRDSINEHLEGVRHMLAAYAGPESPEIAALTEATQDQAHSDQPAAPEEDQPHDNASQGSAEESPRDAGESQEVHYQEGPPAPTE